MITAFKFLNGSGDVGGTILSEEVVNAEKIMMFKICMIEKKLKDGAQ